MYNSTAFCLNLKMFLIKPIFSEYCRKFLVATCSAEVMKGCINMLLNFLLLFITRTKFSCILIFSAKGLGGIWVKGTAILTFSCLMTYIYVLPHR